MTHNAHEREIWFWQRIISPHMAGLAAALARSGYSVTYVVEESLSSNRIALGWQLPDLGGANLRYVENESSVAALVASAGISSIHVCQGIRANGRVGLAQRLLAKRGLRQWVVMETVDDVGWIGYLKKWVYFALFQVRKHWFEGVLATGYRTVKWVVDRGIPLGKVFPFAYFLPDVKSLSNKSPLYRQGRVSEKFCFIYVGRLIELKRVNMLIESLSHLDSSQFELCVVGNGPLENELRELGDRLLPGQVRWLGRLDSTKVPDVLREADCLILPSRHDGWGAVVSEALMLGTPAICSDACGSAGVVRASGVGGVFPNGDMDALTELLRSAMRGGRIDADRRESLSLWGRSLGAEAGASYLVEIFLHFELKLSRPSPPWAKVVVN